MTTRGILVLVLSAAGAVAVLAQVPGKVGAAHTIVLPRDHVTVECDGQGTWTRAFAMESERVASTDPAAVGVAQATASRRASGWLNRFLLQPATAESAASEVAGAVRPSEAMESGGAAALSVDAQRRLAAGLVALRAAFSATGGNRPAVRSESGYDPDKSMAWGRRSVRNPAVATATARSAQTPPGLAGGGERRDAGIVGGVAAGINGPPPVRIDGTVTPPIQTYRIEAVYPAIAQSARIQGAVVISVLVGPDGRVRDANIVHSNPLLDAAALEAVRQWEWTPTKVDGVAVPVVMTLTVNFRLQ